MSTNTIYHAFDLGPGDGGKGGVVHKLSTHHKAHTIIKVGGAQGSHGVTTDRANFAFSQWGCGTLEGVNTHITPLMVVSPEGLINEADGLRYAGITNAFDLLTVDERAICATPYHGIISRLKELGRKGNPRGTIGTGVGEAYRDHQTNPELTIYARDLKTDLRAKLVKIRDFQVAKFQTIMAGGVLFDDTLEAINNIKLTKDDDWGNNFLTYCAERFLQAGLATKIVHPEYFKEKILSKDGVAIIESSHGILTDNVYGFVPHTSAIRTLPKFAHSFLEEAGYDNKVVTVGIHRAYTVRHGAGPMPTVDESMSESLLPGSHKEENRWQGKIRTGALDLVLLKYAIDVCGGPNTIDWLAITWFDQIVKNSQWGICERYSNVQDNPYFENGKIKDCPMVGKVLYQEELSRQLFRCIPEIKHRTLPTTRNLQHELCSELLFDSLRVPTNLVSFGPYDRDKSMLR